MQLGNAGPVLNKFPKLGQALVGTLTMPFQLWMCATVRVYSIPRYPFTCHECSKLLVLDMCSLIPDHSTWECGISTVKNILVGVLDHDNIFTGNNKTQKFYNVKNFQIYGRSVIGEH